MTNHVTQGIILQHKNCVKRLTKPKFSEISLPLKPQYKFRQGIVMSVTAGQAWWRDSTLNFHFFQFSRWICLYCHMISFELTWKSHYRDVPHTLHRLLTKLFAWYCAFPLNGTIMQPVNCALDVNNQQLKLPAFVTLYRLHIPVTTIVSTS
jgi:hypothetical protein